MIRYFKYTGEPRLTRGNYGVNLVGGHNTVADPMAISVFDPEFGDSVWISIEAGLSSGDWIEITNEEYAKS